MNRVALLRDSIESFLKVSLLAPPHLQAYVGVPLAFEQVVSQLLTPLEKVTFSWLTLVYAIKNCNILHFLGIQETPKPIIQNLASCTLFCLSERLAEGGGRVAARLTTAALHHILYCAIRGYASHSPQQKPFPKTINSVYLRIEQLGSLKEKAGDK